MTHDLPLADELAAVSARMSGLLLSTATVNNALALITSLAKETFPGTAGSGLTLLDPHGGRVTAAATDQVVEQVDALQYALGQGPCLTAWLERTPTRVDDVAVDDRWPVWANAAAEVGMRSVLSAPLVSGDDALGALKLYSRTPDAYGERDARMLTMFAAQAAIMLANMHPYEEAQRVSLQLKDAFHGRDTIALAKGVVMGRDGVDEQTAFVMLADIGQREHRTLREVAERLVQSTVRHRR